MIFSKKINNAHLVPVTQISQSPFGEKRYILNHKLTRYTYEVCNSAEKYSLMSKMH